MKKINLLLILCLAGLFIVMNSCSKKDDSKPKKGYANLIVGSWYVTEHYILSKSGDTLSHDYFSRSDETKYVFKKNGVVSTIPDGSSLPQQAYYKVVDNLIYSSDVPLPEQLSTSLIDGFIIRADYIDKLNSKLLITRIVDDDGTITNSYAIFNK